MWFRGKRVILGVSGSIAAYKSAFLTRELIKAGAEVQVVMTASASDFISPLTLATLSKRPVWSDLIKSKQSGEWNNHVELAQWADVIVVAPVSSNTLAKLASGQTDNLLLITLASSKCPVFFAPAMDLDMFRHGANTENIEKLQKFGHILLPSEIGELASGLEGEGRMAEPENIMQQVNNYFFQRMPLRGKKALVTAGPTYEAIDPVRFIGNFSSGKMGFAIAETLADQGAEVTLVCGPNHLTTSHRSIERIDVNSAAEMFDACKSNHAQSNIVVMSAAVADYRPAQPSQQKIKKGDSELTISLVRNPDILRWMGEHKPKNQILVGFALETENAEQNAQKKTQSKKSRFDCVELFAR